MLVPQTGETNEETNLLKWLRIAGGLELLGRMARDEKNPVRQDALYAMLSEAKCVG